MADSKVILNPGVGGDSLDAETVTTTQGAVKRERMEIAGSGATEIARVQSTDPNGTEQGLVTRNIPSGTQTVNDGGGSLTVDAASLPLPTGASTSANQASEIALLTTIDADTSNLDTQLSTRATESTLATRAADATITARLGTLGQKPMAASTPVVIASDQSAIPITGSITASDASVGITGAAVPGSTQQNGGTDGTNLRANRMFDLDSGAGSEFNLGVSLRKSASGGSVELGTSSDPVRIDPVGTTAQPITDNGGSITVDGSVSVVGSVAVTGPLTDAQLRASAVPVSAASLPLPTGAATEATLATLLTDTQLRASAVPVSAASLPLPAGAATSALQTTGNTSLSSIDTKTPALVSGRVPVDGSGVTQPVSAASLPLPTGASTEATLALIKAKTDNLDVALSTRAVTGLTDAQLRASAVPVSMASAPLPTGAATEATLSAINTKIPASPSQEHTTAASPNAARLSDGAAFYDAAKTGQLPTSLVSGRLDVNSGAWLGSTAPTVGQKTMANAIPVSIASDQTDLAIKSGLLTGSGTVTAVDATGPLSAFATFTSHAPSANSSVAFDVSGYSSVVLQITGTWTGSMYWEASADSGNNNFFLIPGIFPGETSSNQLRFNTSAAATVRINTTGLRQVRVRAPLISVSAITSVSVVLRGVQGAVFSPVEAVFVGGVNGNANTTTTNPVLVGGFLSSNSKTYSLAASSKGVVAAQDHPLAIAAGTVTGLCGTTFGQVTTSATTNVVVSNTTYTEQSSGAQRSVASSSANDSSAGTGIRTIRIYYSKISGSTVTTGFTTDLTMNGTTPVNTTPTDIYNVEKIEALTVGSGGVSAGTISMYTTTGGGGSVFCSIATGDRVTRHGRHWVPSGTTCVIRKARYSSGVANGNMTTFELRWKDPTVSNVAERALAECMEVDGEAGTFSNDYECLSVPGPAVIIPYVTPGASTANVIQRVEYTWIEP